MVYSCNNFLTKFSFNLAICRYL